MMKHPPHEHPASALDFDHPPADPVPLFERWFAEAQRLPTPNPNAMTLATIDSDGAPSARIVLLRGFSQDGARFFTNRNSRKGRALAANARAALLVHWDLLDRQVRIEGRVGARRSRCCCIRIRSMAARCTTRSSIR